MITVLAWIFVFGLLIMIHELGHYMVAKWTGVKVLEFSFGFGPKLFGHQGKETLYSLRLFPLGGFVRMYGMDAEIDESGQAYIAPADDSRSFMNKKVWQRIAIIAAGPVMNFILAMVLFIMVFAYLGVPVQAEGNAIGTLIPDKPAVQAGLKVGDRIISVNGIETPDWTTLTSIIHKRPNQEISMVVLRDTEKLEINIKTVLDPQTGNGMIGIAPNVLYQQASILESIKFGFMRTLDFTKFIMITLVQMITGKIPADVGGPVMIAQAVGEAAEQGLANLLGFTGVISIQLGLLNLFPIPALDGSRIIFLFVEGLRGRPLKPERENLIHLVGFVLLLAFAVLITYHDILRLLGKGG